MTGTSLTSKMPPAPLYVRTSLPLVTDHMWRFLSKDPEARSSPLGENATEYTGCVCCVRWCKHSPVSPFHSLHRAAIRLRGSHVKSWLIGAWRYSNHPKVYTSQFQCIGSVRHLAYNRQQASPCAEAHHRNPARELEISGEHLMEVSKDAETSISGRWGLSVPGPVGDHLMV